MHVIRSLTAHRGRRLLGGFAGLTALALAVSACGSSSHKATKQGSGSSGSVLLVGTYKGHAGQYKSIQAAVDAAKPGDWILVAPGDYHETADLTNPPASFDHGDFGGVYITKANLHLRGMGRSSVVVDGTKAGSSRCSADPSAQQFGAKDSDGKAGWPQRHRRVEGERREHREPHRLQLPGRQRATAATRCGGTAVQTPGRSGCTATPAGTSRPPRPTSAARRPLRSTGSSRPTRGVRALDQLVRE